MANLPGRSSTSSKTNCSGPMCRRTTRRSFHRLAVRRRFAGGEVSSALLLWAIARTHTLGRRYLRLDCVASRPRLQALYEGIGFRFHSNRQVGTYYVSRYEFDVLE